MVNKIHLVWTEYTRTYKMIPLKVEILGEHGLPVCKCGRTKIWSHTFTITKRNYNCLHLIFRWFCNFKQLSEFINYISTFSLKIKSKYYNIRMDNIHNPGRWYTVKWEKYEYVFHYVLKNCPTKISVHMSTIFVRIWEKSCYQYVFIWVHLFSISWGPVAKWYIVGLSPKFQSDYNVQEISLIRL